jgi:hypothetical protein
MIGLAFAAAMVSLPCDGLQTQAQRDACSVARQHFICWTTESRNISSRDPALLLFWTRGKPITEAMFRLAYERINGCDPEPTL